MIKFLRSHGVYSAGQSISLSDEEELRLLNHGVAIRIGVDGRLIKPAIVYSSITRTITKSCDGPSCRTAVSISSKGNK